MITDRSIFVAMSAVTVAAMVWLVWWAVMDLRAMDESMTARKAERASWEKNHTASAETWAACRAICGEAAALVPVGDGREWVTCACGYPKPESRTVPK